MKIESLAWSLIGKRHFSAAFAIAVVALTGGCTFKLDRPPVDAALNVEVDAAPDIHFRDALPTPDRPPCTPTVVDCNPAGGQYCGDIGDGCDGVIHCPDCQAPDTCGGTGTPGLCGTPGCMPRVDRLHRRRRHLLWNHR